MSKDTDPESSDPRLLNRRQVLGLFGLTTGAAIIGSGGETPRLQESGGGNLYGGTSGMASAFKVGPGLWKGPLSTRSEVPKENGNDFVQTDAGPNNDQYKFYHYNGEIGRAHV